MDRPDALGKYMRCAAQIDGSYPVHADIEHTIQDVRKVCGANRTEAIKIFVPLWQAKGKFAEPIKDDKLAETTILSVIQIELMKKEEAASQRNDNAPNQ